MIDKKTCWDLIEDLNQKAYDGVYEHWVLAGDDQDALEQASNAQQIEFLTLVEDEITDEQWEAFQHYYKTDKDFKIQYESYAGRPMWNVE